MSYFTRRTLFTTVTVFGGKVNPTSMELRLGKPPAREVGRRGLVEFERAVLDESHHAPGRDGLGDGASVEDRLGGHGPAGCGICHAEARGLHPNIRRAFSALITLAFPFSSPRISTFDPKFNSMSSGRGLRSGSWAEPA